MMRLDFNRIHSKNAGTTGTMGTPRIHAGFLVPETEISTGTNGDRKTTIPDLSPMSPCCPHPWGYEKHSVYAVVPNVPAVPAKKQSNELESESAALRRDLARFRFDLIEAEIIAEYPAAELHRVNNMAWEFMQVDGLDFNTAIRMAAEICIDCPPAPCEAAYSGVRSLWRQENQQREGTR